jgi:hypothetical protein
MDHLLGLSIHRQGCLSATEAVAPDEHDHEHDRNILISFRLRAAQNRDPVLRCRTIVAMIHDSVLGDRPAPEAGARLDLRRSELNPKLQVRCHDCW